ncbi:MAG: DNA-processing protein DprA [Desulfomonilaceae bacterium]
MEDLFWWLALDRAPFVGPITIAKLISAFGNPQSVFEADPEMVRNKVSISSRVVDALVNYKPDEYQIRKDIDTLNNLGARIITRWDPDYPSNLNHIYDPPALLFVRGNLKPEDEQAIAVVGSREHSNYGAKVTSMITRDLSCAGICIVSGLARGIDTICHISALDAGGRTIGVLGCGLDIYYPRENRSLIEEMAEKGVVISEFRPGMEPLKTNFHRRNRIVSGLCKAVLVVEASRRSGSLITVNHALDQGRDVFAVPGNVLHERSRGTHYLIKQGAALTENAQDVLTSVFPTKNASAVDASKPLKSKISGIELSDLAQHVSECVDEDPITVDTICQLSGLEVRKVLAALMELELLGLIRQSPGKVFSKVV